MAAIFIAKATNITMVNWQQIISLAVLLIISKDAASNGFIVLAASLSVVDYLPVVGVALIL